MNWRELFLKMAGGRAIRTARVCRDCNCYLQGGTMSYWVRSVGPCCRKCAKVRFETFGRGKTWTEALAKDRAAKEMLGLDLVT